MAQREDCGHVFISYVREDAHHVDRLQARLESAGIPVWRDIKDLWPGEVWKRRPRDAIRRNSLAFMPCFSRSLSRRTQSTMFEELIWASEEYRKRNPEVPWIFPVLFEDCNVPTVDLGGGLTLHDLQWVRLAEDQERQLERLITTLKELFSEPSLWEDVDDDARAGVDEPATAGGMRHDLDALPHPLTLKHALGTCRRMRVWGHSLAQRECGEGSGLAWVVSRLLRIQAIKPHRA
jgi:hypothetical protein